MSATPCFDGHLAIKAFKIRIYLICGFRNPYEAEAEKWHNTYQLSIGGVRKWVKRRYGLEISKSVGKGDFPFPFQTSDQNNESELKSQLQAIDFYFKKCRKSMRISYALTGDRMAPAINGIMIKCHTHKCTRVVTIRNFTEGQIVERTDALGKCYL